MKIFYKDLLNFLSKKPSKDLLSKKLFQLGHEHEVIGDIFDMELTPNRGDCLSIIGLARDLNIFFGMSQELNYYDDDIDILDIDFKNNSPRDCPKVSFLEIEIENKIDKYKSYLENYFKLPDCKKINFFTDISNYISYELGQPTHCYDAETIDGSLIFTNKICNSSFKTLLGSEIALKDKNCIFSVEDEIVNLAGVMGGASTACSLNTKKVLVECAYFTPESIIGKSIKYNLNSDAAYKFERGVDIGCHDLVLRRFIKIVSEHTNIKSIKMRSFDFQKSKNEYIPMDVNKINQILGINLDKIEFIKILTKLGFELEGNKIFAPTYRNDISFQNDLAEEVARVIGYNNIKSSPIFLPKKEVSKKIDKEMYIKNFLKINGFSETINFPFDSNMEKSAITIDNPLDSNSMFFRTKLKPSIVKNFIYNQRRQQESIKLFEISDIYYKNNEISYRKKLGLIVGGRNELNYKNFSQMLSSEYLNDLLNSKLSKDIFIIHEITPNELQSKKKDKVFYAEVFIDDIPDEFFKLKIDINKSINFIKYRPVSEFPSSSRDLSFSITDISSYDKVIYLLDLIKDEIVKKSFIFDFYKNKKKGILKLGVRIIFQSNHKTLSENDINKKLNELAKPILELSGVFIEGI